MGNCGDGKFAKMCKRHTEPIPPKELTVDKLATLMQTAINDQAIQKQATLLSQSIGAEDGVNTLCRYLINISKNSQFNKYKNYRLHLLVFSLVMLGITSLVIYSLYLVLRNLGDRGKLILCLALIPWLIILLIDLVTTNNRASISRYLMPCWLSLQIAVAYLFAHKLNSIHAGIKANSFNFIPTKFAWFWQGSLSVILCLGLLSYGTMTNTVVWWSHRLNYNNPQIAEIVNQSDRPLILSKIDMNIVTLSYRLADKVRIKPVETKFPSIESEFRDLFLYIPEELIAGFQTDPNYQIKPFPDMRIVEPYSPSFWKISKK